MPQPVERRLAAILAADVAGYSRLIGADEEATLARLRAHRRGLIEPKVREHHGRIVKTTGDGFLIEFASVVDAVRYAVEVQRAMLDREVENSEVQRIRFRIGLNLGDVIVEEGDIFGDGVNVAARLEALAAPGGICVSQVVHDQIRDRLPLAFDDMGEQTVHNIARPVRAYAMGPEAIAALPAVSVSELPAPPPRRRPDRRVVAMASAVFLVIAIVVGGWWLWSSRGERVGPPATASQTQPVRRMSIVVLPFENLSKDPDQEYFADGMTDDLTTDLSRLAGSFVISRTTAFTYKGKAVDVKQIGRDLGVRYVLEGSVRRSGNQVHINVQLIDAASGAHVWADQFDADRANLAEMQSEITARLANTLSVALVRDAGRRIAEEKSTDPDAQDLVLRGRDWSSKPLSAATLREAQLAFLQALQREPQLTDAKTSLAGLLTAKIINGFSDSPEQDKATAGQLLRDVLDRDPDQAGAHAVMGIVLRLQGSLTESKTELETALQLDPNQVTAHRQLGFTLFFLGQPAAAIVEGESAVRLSPRDPFLWGAYQLLGFCRLHLGQLEQAVDALVKSRDGNPHNASTYFYLAAALALKGDLDAGKAALREGLKLNPKANSVEYFRGPGPCSNTPECNRLREQTLFEGLRRLGLPEK